MYLLNVPVPFKIYWSAIPFASRMSGFTDAGCDACWIQASFAEFDMTSLIAAHAAWASARNELLSICSSRERCDSAARSNDVDNSLNDSSDASSDACTELISICSSRERCDIAAHSVYKDADDAAPESEPPRGACAQSFKLKFDSTVLKALKKQLPFLEGLSNILHAAISDIDQAICISEDHLKLRNLRLQG